MRVFLLTALAAASVAHSFFSDASAQPAASEQCMQFQSQLQSACCGAQTSRYQPDGRLFYSLRVRPDFVAVDNCEGGSVQVRCVRRAAIDNPVAPAAPRTQEEVGQAGADASMPACRATWLRLHNSPGAEDCGIEEIPSCGADVEISSLPICEDLEAYNRAPHCSVWSLRRCAGYRGEAPYSREAERDCLQQWTMEAAKTAQKELHSAFTADDAKLAGLVYPKSNNPPGDAALATPSAPDASSLAASERFIPGFRIEVPGNFWRYNTRVVASAVIANLGDDFADGGVEVNGVRVHGDCRADDLSCRLNQAHLVNLPKIIADKRQFVDPSTAGTGDQPQGFINAKVRRSEKGWDVSDVEFNAGPFSINWWGTAKLVSERPLSFRLSGPDTHLTLLPLHDPKNQNPPYRAANLSVMDSKARYIDRTWVLWGMPTQVCRDLRALTYKDNAIVPGPSGSNGLGAGAYRTFIEPYKCACATPGGVYGVNYCVVDPHPRQVSIGPLASGLPDRSALAANIARINTSNMGRLSEVFCDPASERVNRNPLRDLGPGPQTYFTSESIGNVFGPGVLAADMQGLRRDIFEFGCMGRNIPRLAAGDARTLNADHEPRREGPEIGSGIAFEFETKVDLGSMRTWVSPSPITMEFPNVFKAHKWIKKKIPLLTGFWADVVGWIVTFVLAIFSVVLTVVVSLHLVWIAPVVTALGLNLAADMDFGEQTVIVDGVISYHRDANQRTQSGHYVTDGHLEVGVRRIVTTAPTVVSDPWVIEWSAPACNDIVNGEGKEGFEEVLNFLKNLAYCPLEAIGNLYGVLTLPVKNFLHWILRDLVFDLKGAAEAAVTAVVIDELSKASDDANLVALMTSSLEQSLDVPEHLITDQNVKNNLAAAQPHLNQICALAGVPVADCAVSRLFAFYGEGPSVMRLGAKTHYRSMQDYGVSSVTQILDATPFARRPGEPFHPPVRYCYGGDVPTTGLADYSDAGMLRTLTTLDEMHHTASGALPTDWRTQCASLVDIRVRGDFRLQLGAAAGANVVVAPSTRSNFLLNEVFFCPDQASCDMGLDLTNVIACVRTTGCNVEAAIATAFQASNLTSVFSPIRVRASRAACSLMGDIWFNVGGPNARYRNLIAADPVTAQSVLVGAVAATCPVNSDCGPQINAINENFAQTVAMCRVLLPNYGLFDMNRTVTRSDFPPEVLSP